MEFDIVRSNPTSDREALALASRSWPAPERNNYENALCSLIETGQEHHVLLVAARQNSQLVAAQIGQVLPGRVAVVWPPCFAQADIDRPAAAKLLFDRITNEAAAAGAQLAQGLTNPDDTESKQLFTCGEFAQAAELLYLAADPEDSLAIEDLPFQLAPALGDTDLAAIIDRTYVGTLDCPSLDGLRQTANVIAGYRTVGIYRPDLWLIARQAGQDVGCLLVNLHPDVSHAEIIYLALIPEVRGRGWGRLLAEVAKKIALDAGYAQVVLAVDATNRPAIELYEKAGFRVFDRRAVWIKPLDHKPQIITG